MPAATWSPPLAAGPVCGSVALPGSKSITNRALLLASLADAPAVIRAPLRSRDTHLMAAGLRLLGARIEGSDDWTVTPASLIPRAGADVDCGNAGTVARFLPAVAALAAGPVRFHGDPRMSERPLRPLLDALRRLGARIDGDALPMTVHGRGRLAGGRVPVEASGSSQFVSGLLLAAARFERGLTVSIAGPPAPSAPLIELTLRMLAEHGVPVRRDGPPDRGPWTVGRAHLVARDRSVEPDLSSASAFLAAAVATAGRVRVPGWPAETAQPGRLLPELLGRMGARCTVAADGLTVTGPDGIAGLEADLRDHGEAVPTLTALAVLAETPSRFTGIGHLRLHETDRLRGLAEELGRLGARVEATDSVLQVQPAPLRAGRDTVLEPRGDHRLAMAFAVVGLRVPGFRIADPETTAKTVPGFPRLWSQLVTR